MLANVEVQNRNCGCAGVDVVADVAVAGSQDAFATWLGQQIAGPWAANVTEWTSCVTPGNKACVQGWAEESTALACTYAYTDENGGLLLFGGGPWLFVRGWVGSCGPHW